MRTVKLGWRGLTVEQVLAGVRQRLEQGAGLGGERIFPRVEAIGAAVMVVGLIWSVVLATVTWRADSGRRGYQVLRETFGGVLLLGLEILVAADLIRTVAVSPTLQGVAVLGLIVLIRTFLSF
ncbi:MAG TPA: DUF1622 domain-containing protein [Streptosporangiaceae bacterium]